MCPQVYSIASNESGPTLGIPQVALRATAADVDVPVRVVGGEKMWMRSLARLAEKAEKWKRRSTVRGSIEGKGRVEELEIFCKQIGFILREAV